MLDTFVMSRTLSNTATYCSLYPPYPLGPLRRYGVMGRVMRYGVMALLDGLALWRYGVMAFEWLEADTAFGVMAL